MTIVDAAVNRSRTVVGILLLLLVAGTAAYISIPKESDPDVNIPIIYVSLSHEGISPEDAERLLVRPMEIELRSIEGVKEMRSTSYQGGANVLMEFEAGFDADAALIDVREKVDIAKTELPDDTDEPTVNEVNLSLFPVIVVTLSGDVPERTLMAMARDLRDKIEGIPTVLEVSIGGDRDEQVELVFEPRLIESYELDAVELLDVLARSNRLVAAGAQDTGEGRFSIKVPGLFETREDILGMPLKVAGDAVITVGDVATVRRTFKDRETVARVDGKPAVTLEVSKRTGENIIDTIESVKQLVTSEQQNWPTNVVVKFSQDQSKTIRQILGDLQNNVLSAIILVMIVVVAALGLRSGILVAIAIPGSFLTAMLVLQLLGLTVNIVVLFSLILAVGMLVDGAIVVTEYADRKLSEGETPEQAYTLAAKRMAWPITASTATTLAAFAPLLFWPGIVGEFMKFLPITLVATLTASLAMALLFVPVLGVSLAALARLLILLFTTVGMGVVGGGAAFMVATRAIGLEGGPLVILPVAVLGLLAAFVGSRIGLRLGGRAYQSIHAPATPNAADMRALSAQGRFDPKALRGGTGVYVRVLQTALRRPGLVLGATLLGLVGAWGAYGVFGKGVEFFPEVEPDVAIVQIHARGNLSVREKLELVREVEARILKLHDEHQEFASIYTLAGNLQSQDDDQAEDLAGTISLEFADWTVRRPANLILADIVDRTDDLAGILVETRKEESGPPVGKPVQVQLSAVDPDLLPAEIAKVRRFVDGLEGIKDVEDTRPIPGIEWEIEVDRAQAAKFGTDVTAVGNAVKLVTNGIKISDFRPNDADDEIDIVARFPLTDRTINEMDRIRIATPQGLVPISNFVTRTPVQQTGQLRRVDSARIMKVLADVEPGVLADDKVQEIREWLPTAGIDPRVTVEFRGEDEEQAAAQAFLQKAFAVALFLMAIILVTQFNSFYSAGLILSAVVMSTIGVMLGLLVTGQPFGIVMSGIGVIALAGIVVNNNIVLIDTYDRLKKTFPDPMEAILRTGAQRLRPVLLTTVTTILGLMPMVLQLNIDLFNRVITAGAPSTQWWVQLATAIAFGLAFATVLTLIVTPSALMLRARRQYRKSGADKSSDEVAPPPVTALPQAAE